MTSFIFNKNRGKFNSCLMSARQTTLTLCSLGRINIAFQGTTVCLVTPVTRNQSRNSWHKYLILRLSLWPGPLFTSDKKEKDGTSQIHIDLMHTKQTSVKHWR